jgi:carbamoyltransferase
MEFGPRALGNRSMLARPTDNEINKTLNARLARTEFMPFAPSVLEEHAAEIFDNAGKSADCLPFMTITCNVKQEWRARITGGGARGRHRAAANGVASRRTRSTGT